MAVLRAPLTWYVIYLVILSAGAGVVLMLALPGETTEQLGALLATLAALPPVLLTVVVASRLPSRPTSAPSALEGPARWALGAVWTAATFATGAFMATLVGFDLGRAKSAASMNEYFCSFLTLVVVSVFLIAVMGLLFVSAWMCFRSNEATFTRAAIRALMSAARRDRLPLRTRMWLNEVDDDPNPLAFLAAAPATARAVAFLRLASECGGLFLATFVLLVSVLVLYPTVISWVS